MNRQEIFEKMVRGLAAQGWQRSTHETMDKKIWSCAYRGAGGLKCAIGHLVPDDKYTADIEDMPGPEVCRRVLGIEDDDTVKLLALFQGYHDSGYRPHEMRNNFGELALRHGLVWPEDVN